MPWPPQTRMQCLRQALEKEQILAQKGRILQSALRTAKIGKEKLRNIKQSDPVMKIFQKRIDDLMKENTELKKNNKILDKLVNLWIDKSHKNSKSFILSMRMLMWKSHLRTRIWASPKCLLAPANLASKARIP